VTPQITEAGTVIMDIQVQKNEPPLASTSWVAQAHAVDAGARKRS